jgi:hypothetical protein
MKLLLNNVVTSWKTSLLGVCLLIGGASFCWVGQWEVGGGFLTSGLTALLSRDYDADHARIEELIKQNKELVEILNNNTLKINKLIDNE